MNDRGTPVDGSPAPLVSSDLAMLSARARVKLPQTSSVSEMGVVAFQLDVTVIYNRLG